VYRIYVTLKSKDRNRNYLVSALLGALWILFIKLLFPSVIPFGAFEFWDSKGSVSVWLLAAWPVFLWVALVNTFKASVSTAHARAWSGDAPFLFVKGLLVSAWAGLAEEICFRWLIFLSTIATLKLVNFLFFGFIGLGIPQWLHVHFFGGLADLTTMGNLHEWLFSPKGWAVGAAMLSTNSFFRDGHKYQGWFGYINSWFIGMFLFWIMFHYGLLAAILVHFVYDVIAFTVSSVGVAIRGR